MCGISGIIYKKNRNINNSDIKKLNNSLAHRGPDFEDYFIDNDSGIALGSRRLKLTGFDKYSEQPFVSDCGKFILLFNGQVFNYLEIRSELEEKYKIKFKSESDTEVVLQSYIIWGEECVKKFNGMWSFFIWNKQNKCAFLSRDRFGEKPFFYIDNDEYFIFASEIKAFKSIKHLVNLKINEKYLYFFSNIESSEKTLVDPIRNLNAGTNAFIKNHNFKTKEWWNLGSIVSKKKLLSYNEAVDEFYHLFENSISLRILNKNKVTTTISGGLDSSSIFYFLNKNKNIETTGYNFNYKNADQENLLKIQDEFKNIVQKEKSNLTLDEITNCIFDLEAIDGEPHYGPWLLYKKMKDDGIKFSLEGHGPDEMFGGYDIDVNFAFKSKNINMEPSSVINEEHVEKIKKNTKVSKLNIKNYLYIKKNQLSYLYNSKKIKKNKTKKMPAINLKDEFNDYLFENFHNGTLRKILRNFDRLSMSQGIEVRSPFLDWRLVVSVFSLPSTYKITDNNTKALMRDAFSSILPNTIRKNKKKSGFSSPVVEFKKNKILFGEINDLINSKDFIKFNNNYNLNKKNIDTFTQFWKYIHAYLLIDRIV